MEGNSLLEQFEQEENANSWVVTFADMMTLLLVFFILLYTLADYEDKAYRAQIAQVNVLDGEGNQISVIDYAMRQGRDPEPLKAVEDMLGLNPSPEVIDTLRPKVFVDLESMIDNTDLSDSISLEAVGDEIHLKIDGRFLFASGKAALKDGASVIFNNLTLLFRENPDYKIAIRGHTDDLDIETVQFPSNWELSAIRATTVLRYFIAQGLDPERMTATGYADFIPLVPNDNPENRAINRRVEFVLEKKKTIDLEFPGESGDHRSAFRVKPDQMSPIIVTVAGNSYHLINISGTGCCFRSHNYPVGFTAPATLKIPNDDIIFPATIRVVAKQRDICRCEFSKISTNAQESIHAYVLKVQKQSIRHR